MATLLYHAFWLSFKYHLYYWLAITQRTIYFERILQLLLGNIKSMEFILISSSHVW